VGKTDSLNVRLNTHNGSIDNFADLKRKFDPERNFIKIRCKSLYPFGREVERGVKKEATYS